MIAVSTPTLMSVVDGMIRTAISAASSSAAPVERARHQQPRRIVADERPHQMRRDQADEADGAGDRDRAADAERDAGDHEEPQAAHIDAEALRGLFAERERAEGVALRHQQHGADGDERQRQHDVAEAAVLQRAEQPERDLQRGERIGREVHGQRRAAPARLEMARPARMRSSRLALRPATTSSRNTEAKRADDGGDRQRERAHVGETERDHRAPRRSGRLRRAEQRRRGERIAQQALQRGAGEPEDRADGKPSIARGRRISCTMMRCSSPAAEERANHGGGGSRTGPMPSEARNRAQPSPRAPAARNAPPKAGTGRRGHDGIRPEPASAVSPACARTRRSSARAAESRRCGAAQGRRGWRSSRRGKARWGCAGGRGRGRRTRRR